MTVKRSMKRLFAVLLSMLFAVSNINITKSSDFIFTDRQANLFVNGRQITNLPMNPVFYHDSLLVPSREVFTPLGAFLEFDDAEKKLYIIYNGFLLVLQADNIYTQLSGHTIRLTIPPRIINDKLLIPLRSVSETLGLEVLWSESTNSAYIFEKSYLEARDRLNQNGDVSNNPWPGNISFPTRDDNNIVTNIYLPRQNERQVFLIELERPTDRFDYHLLEDNRLIIDLFDTVYQTDNRMLVPNNEFVREIRLGTEPTIRGFRTRIVFDKTRQSRFSVSLSEDRRFIFVDFSDYSQNNFINISGGEMGRVSYSGNQLRIHKNNSQINMSDIIQIDDYNNLRYTFVFPENIRFSDVNSRIEVNDQLVRNIEFSHVNNRPVIVINQTRVLAPIIFEDETYIYINMLLPKQRYAKIAVIDPGHGGQDPGAVWNGLREKDLNLDIAQRLKARMSYDRSIRVYLTRNEDVNPSFQQRVAYANTIGDIFISIHGNAATNTAAHGIETFYFNRESVNQRGFSSRALAEIVQRNLLRYTGANNRGVKTNSFFVLRYSDIPAVLVEVGFISNADEVRLLRSDAYRNQLAEALHTSIQEAFQVYTPRR